MVVRLRPVVEMRALETISKASFEWQWEAEEEIVESMIVPEEQELNRDSVDDHRATEVAVW